MRTLTSSPAQIFLNSGAAIWTILCCEPGWDSNCNYSINVSEIVDPLNKNIIIYPKIAETLATGEKFSNVSKMPKLKNPQQKAEGKLEGAFTSFYSVEYSLRPHNMSYIYSYLSYLSWKSGAKVKATNDGTSQRYTPSRVPWSNPCKPKRCLQVLKHPSIARAVFPPPSDGTALEETSGENKSLVSFLGRVSIKRSASCAELGVSLPCQTQSVIIRV